MFRFLKCLSFRCKIDFSPFSNPCFWFSGSISVSVRSPPPPVTVPLPSQSHLIARRPAAELFQVSCKQETRFPLNCLMRGWSSTYCNYHHSPS
ncbi:hypothetical protein Nepgr_002895 [Nepenthes gracilis]|uniref:Uncharacterized protein n=1 Tax=Nepenthes gracilis TaxID=150966 RepID=A0AAD3RYI1_NEPGR|nr:hypothetical protein Nepgr_002895 [Nepenthes gracilis]